MNLSKMKLITTFVATIMATLSLQSFAQSEMTSEMTIQTTTICTPEDVLMNSIHNDKKGMVLSYESQIIIGTEYVHGMAEVWMNPSMENIAVLFRPDDFQGILCLKSFGTDPSYYRGV